MARGDIALDEVEYRCSTLPVQSLANQMAPKSASGESEYSSLSTWSAWIQSDWQGGIGKLDTGSGSNGVLYSDADTRVPNQIILPPRLGFTGDVTGAFGDNSFGSYSPDGIHNTISIGDLETWNSAAALLVTPATVDNTNVFGFYARMKPGHSVTIQLRTNPSGSPGTLFSSQSYTNTETTEGWYWHTLSINTATLNEGAGYWLVIYNPSDEPVELAYKTPELEGLDYETPSKFATDLSGWVTHIQASLLYVTSLTSITQGSFSVGTAQGTHFIRFNGETFHTKGGSLYQWNVASNLWEFVDSVTGGAQITSLAVWGPLLWYTTSTGTYGYWDTSLTEYQIGDATGDDILLNRLIVYGGYIWGSYKNKLYYSATEVPTPTFSDIPDTSGNMTLVAEDADWFGPIEFGKEDNEILSMAGLAGKIYLSTAKALYYLADGDFPMEAFRYGVESSDNGIDMAEMNGALYIPVAGRLFRYTEDGSWTDVWITKDDDLPVSRLGRIDHLHRMNQWLIVYVNASGQDNSRPMLLAYQGTSWHVLAVLPGSPSTQGSSPDLVSYYDRENGRLWIGGVWITPMYIDIDDYAINPYWSEGYTFAPFGWVEWDWFWGNLRENVKDWESVAIMGENINANNSIEVYYKTPNNDDEWQYLGEITEDGQELVFAEEDEVLRQSIAGTRIRLGILLKSFGGDETPRVRAIRLKYHTMVKDWWRWNLNIHVSGGIGDSPHQELYDGPNPLTGPEMKIALDALSLRSTPFVYRDVDEQEYWVKIQEASFRYDKHARRGDPAISYWDGIYNLTIEQVRSE